MSNAKDLGLCNDKIVSVERTNGTGAPGTIDTYTITLRSGDTYNFEVTNGSAFDASPKGVYATLSDLQSAFPTGNDNIYIVSANGHWYWWNNSEWSDGGVYQGVEISDGSVTPVKTTFALNQDVNNVNFYNGNVYTGYNDHIRISGGTNNNIHCNIQYSINPIWVKINDNNFILKVITCDKFGGNLVFGSWTNETIYIPKNTYFILEIATKEVVEDNTYTIAEMKSKVNISNNEYLIEQTTIIFVQWALNTQYFFITPNENIKFKLTDYTNYYHNVWILGSEKSTSEVLYKYDWQEKDIILKKGVNYAVFIRNKNANTFVFSDVLNLISMETTKIITKDKYLHISFDDCIFWTDLIDNAETYNSIFENSILKNLKLLHTYYGTVFTLNTFNASGDYDISNVPTKFANEFKENSEWLKFAFHAEDGSTRYDTDKVGEITTSYNKFTNAIYKMTGTIDTIDRVTRLGFFTGTLSNVKAIRDCNCGICGLLTADDIRISYYFDTDTNNYMLEHAKYFDSENQLTFVKSQTRLESISDMTNYLNNFNSISKGNMNRYLEIFTHEYEFGDTILNKLTQLCEWAVDNGYTFVFYENVFKV